MSGDYASVRTGIVGLGNIGHHHADRLVDLGVPLEGGMDIDHEARTRFADRYDVDVYDGYHSLYDDVDAVIITTPNKFHEKYAVAALERDQHVLLEKPLAHTVESARRIADAASASSGTSQIGFNNRFLNAVQLIKNRIERGDFGDLIHVEANYVRRRGVPGRGSWFTRREISGGGSLIDLGVHAIDLSMYLLGYPDVEEVSGITRSTFGDRDDYAYLEMWGADNGSNGFDVDDSASAFIRCTGEHTVSLEVAWATNRPPTHEFVVRGTEAAARFDLLEGDLTIHSASADGQNHLLDTAVEVRENDTHTDEQRAFFDAITTSRDTGGSIDDAVTVQEIIDAIYRSSEGGHTVALDGAVP
ncbi:Gfo/Idh/MocA family protein [Natrinema gelatinilyticum]|uniref:Gfo/Idh/MocA family protein n=1 Tax=Natrinema gelatinilyticum TaxID=2961571 RepID=UPI0020C29C39|nr:Gfo/Idh/MocA family oxidoreductase [Natrinema gelatinilyticum]